MSPKEKNLISCFKVVGGLKCYLIAGLIQDFEISRKSGQCPLLSKDFSSHMIYKAAPRSSKCWQPLAAESTQRRNFKVGGMCWLGSQIAKNCLGYELKVCVKIARCRDLTRMA